jgi:hypothetical protein
MSQARSVTNEFEIIGSKTPKSPLHYFLERSTLVDSASLRAAFAESKLVLEKLKWELQSQPPPPIAAQR